MHEPLFSWLARERLAELRREAEAERRATAARGPRPHPAARFLIRVGRFDHDETVRYLSLAENWLGWRGRLVRAATLGFVDPRRMVDAELCKTLREARTTFSLALWWVALQAALRILFGLTLWLIWAAHG